MVRQENNQELGVLVSKRKYCEKEYDLLDRLKKENKFLKRQITTLKRQLDRVNPGNIDEIRAFAARQEERRTKKLKQKKEEEKWKCYECGRGKLYIVDVPHPNGLHYFRSCDFCNHRTKIKKKDKSVTGLCKTKDLETK